MSSSSSAWPESLAQVNVGNEQVELSVKVQEEDAELLAHDDPVLGEAPATQSRLYLYIIIIIKLHILNNRFA